MGRRIDGEVTTSSPEETIAWGEAWGKQLPPTAVVCLTGNLAAGKTTLAKGIAAGVTGISPDDVQSPTFVYLNVYPGKRPLFHFDLYRLSGEEEFLAMGFDDYFDANGVCLIEWSERIPHLLPREKIVITCEAQGETVRKYTVSQEGEVGQA